MVLIYLYNDHCYIRSQADLQAIAISTGTAKLRGSGNKNSMGKKHRIINRIWVQTIRLLTLAHDKIMIVQKRFGMLD